MKRLFWLLLILALIGYAISNPVGAARASWSFAKFGFSGATYLVESVLEHVPKHEEAPRESESEMRSRVVRETLSEMEITARGYRDAQRKILEAEMYSQASEVARKSNSTGCDLDKTLSDSKGFELTIDEEPK